MKTKFEITKEQILQLNSYNKYNCNVYLKQWFPQAFQNELEVGKWYKHPTNLGNGFRYIYAENIRNGKVYGYGINGYGNWEYKYDINHKNDLNKLELATDKEVETALINEAKKRGFKEGVRFKRVNSITCKCDDSFDTIKRKLQFDGVGLITSIDYIFFKGIWAEIISEPIELTLEQIAEKFNVNVEQLKIKK